MTKAKKIIVPIILLVCLAAALAAGEREKILFVDSHEKQRKLKRLCSPEAQESADVVFRLGDVTRNAVILYTATKWSSCSSCRSMENATRSLQKAILQVQHNKKLEKKALGTNGKIIFALVDCTSFVPGPLSPCSDSTRIPSLFVTWNKEFYQYNSFDDVFGLYNFLRVKLPAQGLTVADLPAEHHSLPSGKQSRTKPRIISSNVTLAPKVSRGGQCPNSLTVTHLYNPYMSYSAVSFIELEKLAAVVKGVSTSVVRLPFSEKTKVELGDERFLVQFTCCALGHSLFKRNFKANFTFTNLKQAHDEHRSLCENVSAPLSDSFSDLDSVLHPLAEVTNESAWIAGVHSLKESSVEEDTGSKAAVLLCQVSDLWISPLLSSRYLSELKKLQRVFDVPSSEARLFMVSKSTDGFTEKLVWELEETKNIAQRLPLGATQCGACVGTPKEVAKCGSEQSPLLLLKGPLFADRLLGFLNKQGIRFPGAEAVTSVVGDQVRYEDSAENVDSSCSQSFLMRVLAPPAPTIYDFLTQQDALHEQLHAFQTSCSEYRIDLGEESDEFCGCFFGFGISTGNASVVLEYRDGDSGAPLKRVSLSTNGDDLKEQLLLLSGKQAVKYTHVQVISDWALHSVVTSTEKGLLVLYYSKEDVHSLEMLPIIGKVGDSFSKDRADVVIAKHEVGRWSANERSVYGVYDCPSLFWYPRESLRNSRKYYGAVPFPGIPHPPSIVEYISEEMGYRNLNPVMTDDLKTSLGSVTRENFDEVMDKPTYNASHILLFLTDPRTLENEKMGALVRARDYFQRKFYENFEELYTQFVKMDGVKYHRLLVDSGLVHITEKYRMPLLLYLPKGGYRFVKAKVFGGADKEKGTNNKGKRVPVARYTVSEILRFAVENIKPPQKPSKDGIAQFFNLKEEDVPREDPALYPGEHITQLTMETFREFIDAKGDVAIFFYASWCHDSQQEFPSFRSIAEMYASDPTIRFGCVNVPENAEVGHHQGIQGFPTVIMYFEGTSLKKQYVGEVYQGSVSPPQDFMKFIDSIRGSSRAAAREKKRLSSPSRLLELDDASFDTLMNRTDTHVLLLFYATWCGHCRHLSSELELLAKHYETRRRDLAFAKIEGSIYQNVSAAYNASEAFPVLMLFVQTRTPSGVSIQSRKTYNDVRFAHKIHEWIEGELPPPPATPKEKVSEQGTDIEEITDDQDEKKQEEKGDVRTPKHQQSARKFSRDVTEFTDSKLIPLIDTREILLVLNYDHATKEEVFETWQHVARILHPLKKKRLTVGVVNADRYPNLRHVLGASTCVVILRGLARPSRVWFNVSSVAKKGEGGSLSSIGNIIDFVEKNFRSADVAATSLSKAAYEKETQNPSLTVAVMLYAPWCTECRPVAEEFDKAAQRLSDVPYIRLRHCDVSRAVSVYDDLGRKPLPALFVYDRKEKNSGTAKVPRYLFAKGLSRLDLEAFILKGNESTYEEQPLHTAPLQTESELEPMHLGDSTELSQLQKQYPRGMLVLLVADWCAHCPEALSTLRGVVPILKATVVVSVLNVTQDITAVRSKYKVKSLPATIFIASIGTHPRLEFSSEQQERFKNDGYYFWVLPSSWKTPERLVELVTGLIDAKDRDSNLPTYDTVLPQPPVNERAKEKEPPSSRKDFSTSNVRVLTSETELQEVLKAQDEPPVNLSVFFVIAKWCSASCDRLNLTAEMTGKKLGKEYIVYILDISSIAPSSKWRKLLKVTSVPAVIAHCGNTVKYRPQSYINENTGKRVTVGFDSPDAVVDFIHKNCAKATDERLVLEKAQSIGKSPVSIPELSLNDLEAEHKVKSVFVLYRQQKRCSKCSVAFVLWQDFASRLQSNPSLLFATVDCAQVEQGDTKKEYCISLPRLVLYPLAGEAVECRSELQLQKILDFLEEEERREHEI